MRTPLADSCRCLLRKLLGVDVQPAAREPGLSRVTERLCVPMQGTCGVAPNLVQRLTGRLASVRTVRISRVFHPERLHDLCGSPNGEIPSLPFVVVVRHWRCGHLQIFFQPGGPSAVHIALMNWIRGGVTGDRVGDQLGLDAVVALDVIEDERLCRGHALVAQVGQHQRRCFDARGVADLPSSSAAMSALKSVRRCN